MKKIREGYKITEFGEIPEEWNIGSIDELTTFIKSGLSRNLKDENVGIPCIRSNNIVNGRINYNDLKYWFLKDDKGANIEDYILNDGDVLVNFINSMAQIGKTCIYRSNGRDAIYTTNIFRVNFNKDKILNEYFYYFSQTDRYKKEIELITKPAVNQASFTTVDFKKIKLAIPIIKEQERIVSILSTVDEQIDNVDALIEKNKELKKGLMQTLLTKGIGHTKFKKTEIGEIPEEWTLVKIGDVAKFQAGYAFKSSDYVDNGVKLVKITNVQQKDLLWNDTDFLPEEFLNKYKEYSLEINDVIIAMTRPIISSGIKICKVKKEDTPALLNQRVGRFITSENVNNKYLYQYCFSNYFINKVNELCSTTGQPNISSNQLESIMISLPSTEEQEKIGSILLNVDEKMEEYENKKQRLEELKKGLMQQLLTGNIRII